MFKLYALYKISPFSQLDILFTFFFWDTNWHTVYVFLYSIRWTHKFFFIFSDRHIKYWVLWALRFRHWIFFFFCLPRYNYQVVCNASLDKQIKKLKTEVNSVRNGVALAQVCGDLDQKSINECRQHVKHLKNKLLSLRGNICTNFTLLMCLSLITSISKHFIYNKNST